VPVRSIDLVGEQVGAVWKFVNRIPEYARVSRFGVVISPPNEPKSDQPRSSATINKMLGLVWFLSISVAHIFLNRNIKTIEIVRIYLRM
jgi:hypothetical protein|tara:strand:- start:78 stop:344 length:267 start_codon:yes stop_codon:yes gene_type:complete